MNSFVDFVTDTRELCEDSVVQRGSGEVLAQRDVREAFGIYAKDKKEAKTKAFREGLGRFVTGVTAGMAEAKLQSKSGWGLKHVLRL